MAEPSRKLSSLNSPNLDDPMYDSHESYILDTTWMNNLILINPKMSEELILNNEPEKSSISYAMAKLSGIYTCKALNKDFKKNICISLIPASCYGPNDNFDPISSHVLSGIMRKMIDAKNTEAKKVILWGSGDIKREFIFVDDVSRAILSLLNKELFNNSPITNSLFFTISFSSYLIISPEKLLVKYFSIISFWNPSFLP